MCNKKFVSNDRILFFIFRGITLWSYRSLRVRIINNAQHMTNDSYSILLVNYGHGYMDSYISCFRNICGKFRSVRINNGAKYYHGEPLNLNLLHPLHHKHVKITHMKNK